MIIHGNAQTRKGSPAKRNLFAVLTFVIVMTTSICASAMGVKIFVQEDARASTMHGATVLKNKLHAMGFNAKIIRGMNYSGGNGEIVIADASLGGKTDALAREMKLDVPGVPESFVVTGEKDFLVGVGSDSVGAMYAAYDIAEQLESAISAGKQPEGLQTRTRIPFMEIRAVNQFFHVEAFQDQDSWYYDEEFWETYLDELSWDRYNLLDIHAMYGLISTFFPNCYLYLLKSDKYPDMGIDAKQAEKNLAMLNRIIEMAGERGIRVSLMSYHASRHLTAASRSEDDGHDMTDDDLAEYTRDVVRQIIEKCPGLWMIGFRIGESGRSEDFFEKSYIAGIDDAGRDVKLFTRTWLASPWQVMKIADAYPGRTFLEIKYNGEQLGLPYHSMTTNRRGTAPSYTYENYTDWPRNYKIIWQIRSNGTHRLFRWGDPVFAERTMRSIRFGSAAGFTMEPMTAYYPMKDYFFKPSLGFDFFKWDHQRNWFWYMVWGRLAYNPDAGEDVWLNRFRLKFGDAAPDVYETVVQMSRIVPLIYSWRCIGPDHRNMAPEYETGGDLNDFTMNYPLDPDNIYSIREYVNHYLFNDPMLGTKLNPFEAADMLDEYAWAAEDAARRALGKIGPDAGGEFKSLQIELDMLGNLARYYSNKIRAATYFEFFRQKNTLPEYVWAQKHTMTARYHWAELSDVGEEYYLPILDTLRMKRFSGKPEFTWKELLPELKKDKEILKSASAEIERESVDEKSLFVYHLPRYVAPEDEPLRVSATIYNISNDVVVTLHYRAKGNGSFKKIPLEKERRSPTYTGEIPAGAARGELEYFITATLGDLKAKYPGKRNTDVKRNVKYSMEDYADGYAKSEERERKKRIEFERGKYVTVTFTRESDPPEITIYAVNVKEHGTKAEIIARVEDESAVREVELYFKPMPTNFQWESVPMEPLGDSLFSATLDLTPSGLLYYIHAADASYNSAAYPDFLQQTPYLNIDSWDPAVSLYE